MQRLEINLKASDMTDVEELTFDDEFKFTVTGNAFKDYVAVKSVTADVLSSGNGFTFNPGKTKMMKNAAATIKEAPSSTALYTYDVMKNFCTFQP